MRVRWRHLANTTELVLPSTNSSPQPKRQTNRFSHFCTAHGRKSLYFPKGDHFLKIAPSDGGSGPPSNIWLLGPIPAHNPYSILISSAILHRWPQTVTILYNGMPLYPSKLPLAMGGSGPPSNTRFPGPTQVLNPNGISIGSAIFAGVTSVIDWPTDHSTQSVTIDTITQHHNHFKALCPGLLGWAGTRRNSHPPKASASLSWQRLQLVLRYINNFNGKLSSIDERLIKSNINDNPRVMIHNRCVQFFETRCI